VAGIKIVVVDSHEQCFTNCHE